ncbi:MAG: hypothetical protein JWN49_471 [Parcubacteria group bacterium]|nr:hypothetical protein [Parcubacteria group bacterium]
MKKVLAMSAIALFFLAVLGLVLFKLFSSTGTTATSTPTDGTHTGVVFPVAITTDSPQQAVVSCYKWYVGAYNTGSTLATISSQPQASQCFTDNFINTWQQILSNTGSDAVLVSQSTLSSWEGNIQARVVGQSIRSADMEVTLGTGYAAMNLIAHVILENDSVWKIDSVTLDPSQPSL